MADTWNVTFKPTPKPQPGDKARIFVEFQKVPPAAPPPPPLTPTEAVNAYIQCLVDAGDSIPPASETALLTYVNTLEADGVWDKIELLMPFLGNTAKGQITAIKTVSQVPPQGTGFVDGDANGNHLGNFSDPTAFINTNVKISDLASQTNIVMSVGVACTISAIWCGVNNVDASGDEAYWTLQYADSDTPGFTDDRTVYGHFGHPVFQTSGDFINSNVANSSGGFEGLFTGAYPSDTPRIQVYYADEFVDSTVIGGASPITAPIGNGSPTRPANIHLFGYSGAGGATNHTPMSLTQGHQTEWFVLGSNWTVQNITDYLTATMTLNATLGKNFKIE